MPSWISDPFRLLLFFAWALGGALTSGAESGKSPARPPNIVFIMADDLGHGHLGCYGQQHIATPNIDRLAAGGMRFTQAYAGASNCAPSRSTLLTGLHGGHASVRANDGGIPLAPGERTLGDVLRADGYATGGFGKWGLGDAETVGAPWDRGFDRFFGYLHQKHAHFYYTPYLWDNGRKFFLAGNERGGQAQYSHDVILQHAMNFLRERRDRPFFCYLPFTMPHHELIAPAKALAEYSGKFEENPLKQWREGYANPAEPKATLAAMVSHLDRSVGMIVALLEELGIAENTLVVFTSDNGAEDGPLTNAKFFNANGGLRGYKQSLYEGGIRVPAIFRWPGRIKAGAVVAQPWYFPDVLPTLRELGGAAGPMTGECDGISFAPTLLGEPGQQKQHDYLYWEKRESNGRLLQALRQQDWKLLRVSGGGQDTLELYNLARDPSETNNLATAENRRAQAMLTLLATARREPPPQIEPTRPAGMDYR